MFIAVLSLIFLLLCMAAYITFTEYPLIWALVPLAAFIAGYIRLLGTPWDSHEAEMDAAYLGWHSMMWGLGILLIKFIKRAKK